MTSLRCMRSAPEADGELGWQGRLRSNEAAESRTRRGIDEGVVQISDRRRASIEEGEARPLPALASEVPLEADYIEFLSLLEARVASYPYRISNRIEGIL